MHWKLQCLQPALFNRKGPILFHPTVHFTTNASKVEQIGLRSLASSAIFTDFSPANYYVFKRLRNFLQGKHFHNQKEAENAFQEFIESQGSDFYAIGINKCFLLEKNVLIVMVLINKDVFEPSYNDLKFKVQNCNCFCTNLITSLSACASLKLPFQSSCHLIGRGELAFGYECAFSAGCRPPE